MEFFSSFVLVHSFFPIIIGDMLPENCESNLQQGQMFYDVTLKFKICKILGFRSYYLHKKVINQKMITVLIF